MMNQIELENLLDKVAEEIIKTGRPDTYLEYLKAEIDRLALHRPGRRGNSNGFVGVKWGRVWDADKDRYVVRAEF